MGSIAHPRFFRLPQILGLSVVLTAILIFTGCGLFGTDEDEDEPIQSIAILPDSASMSVGGQVEFSVVALTASGDTVRDHDLETRWWSTDTTVFTVNANGLAVGQDSGSAFCVVELSDEGESSNQAGKTGAHNLRTSPLFVGRDSAFVHMF